MIDVDLFKSFNDTYGHGAGDECLRMIAQTGESVMRKSGERFCRYGGEEFAAILPDADEGSALRVAERIREAVATRRTAHERAPEGIVTISVGVATARPIAGMPAESLLNRADHALYIAKQGGRNAVAQDDTPRVEATFRP